MFLYDLNTRKIQCGAQTHRGKLPANIARGQAKRSRACKKDGRRGGIALALCGFRDKVDQIKLPPLFAPFALWDLEETRPRSEFRPNLLIRATFREIHLFTLPPKPIIERVIHS